ncbi:MAG: hypothetical protein HeimC2_45590 [Candidatus Heimdallarchaeota archaeon LC_2]|nr:MAG: hypothetical protein HeimC2_45590 [Candidatus Heimdallarchaeota archaeon LC_2]
MSENQYVIDASVVLKWYIEEDLTSEAIEIRNNYINGKINLYAPNILIFEVINTLTKLGNFSKNNLIEIGDSLLSFIIQLDNFSGYVLQTAINMTSRSNSSLFETFYLALSEFYNCQLLTADGIFYNKVLIHYPDAAILHLKDI